MTSVKNGGEWRRRLWNAQNGICPYCARPMPPRTGNWRRFSNLDHVYPRSRHKWRGSIGNILLAHTSCNHRKGNRDPYACEVLILEAVNLSLGVSLNQIPGTQPNVNKSPPRWAGLPDAVARQRRAQSERDRAKAKASAQAM